MSYATLQDAVDGLRADNQVLTDEVIASDATATTAQTDAQAARTAAETAETNAEQSKILSLQYKDSAEAAEAWALQHKTDAEAQVPLAQAEKTGAEAARDTAVLTTLGPDNDKLAAIASVYGQPSLNLDFAKQSFWKQGTYPWNQDTLDPAVDLTFTRASTATYFDANGVMQTAAADAMRFDHDPVTGESLGVLLEESRTNSLLDSGNPTTANWVGPATFAQNAVGLGGVANTATTLTDDAAQLEDIKQTIAVPVDTNTHTAQFFIGKDNDETRFPDLSFSIIGGSTAQTGVQLNTKTGALTVRVSANTAYVEDWGDFWRVVVSVTNNGSAGNTTLNFVIRPAATTTFGAVEAAATGSIVYAGGQVELNTTYPTSYTPTAGAAVTRAADNLSRTLGAEYNALGHTLVVEASSFLPNTGVDNTYNRNAPVVSLGTYFSRSLGIGRNDSAGGGYAADVFFRNTSLGGSQAMSSDVSSGTFPLSTQTVMAASLSPKALIISAGGESNTTMLPDVPVGVGPLLTIGRSVSYNERLHGHVQRLEYYPRAMTEAELIEVTS